MEATQSAEDAEAVVENADDPDGIIHTEDETTDEDTDDERQTELRQDFMDRVNEDIQEQDDDSDE